MLVIEETAGFQETILSFSPITNQKRSLLPSVIRDYLMQKAYAYGRLNSSPQRYLGPRPQNLWILPYMSKGIVGVIKWRILIEVGRPSWIIQMGPICNHKCPCKKNAERNVTTEKRRWCDNGGRDWRDVIWRWKKGPQQKNTNGH